jgi:hypothetical protein
MNVGLPLEWCTVFKIQTHGLDDLNNEALLSHHHRSYRCLQSLDPRTPVTTLACSMSTQALSNMCPRSIICAYVVDHLNISSKCIRIQFTFLQVKEFNFLNHELPKLSWAILQTTEMFFQKLGPSCPTTSCLLAGVRVERHNSYLFTWISNWGSTLESVSIKLLPILHRGHRFQSRLLPQFGDIFSGT